MAELRQNPALVCMKKTQAGALKMNYRSRKSILTSQHNDKRQELLREEEKIKGLHLMYQLAVTNKQLNGRVRKAKKTTNTFRDQDRSTSIVSPADKYVGACKSARHYQVVMENWKQSFYN